GEERDHLTVEVTVHAGERDEREVDRVEHQLDEHEHHERVAPQQHTGRADGEQQRRQIQVVSRVHDASSPLRASALEALPAAPTVRCCSIGGTDNSEKDPSGSNAAMSTAL